MNKVILIGRLTKDPDLRYTTSQIPVCSFKLAVSRNYKDSEGNKITDFFPIVAWRKIGEAISKYCRKGSLIAVIGELQTRTWDDERGEKHYITEIIVQEALFLDNWGKNEVKNEVMDEVENENLNDEDLETFIDGLFDEVEKQEELESFTEIDDEDFPF
ncbi:single-stranded DNA-binding protein [Caldanaerobacter subterraneus]|uniref:Single-stranded DNA-binding protein n=1 Tax=Caldanaerobacter subterraneus TaxID=911092 RepID=A0A7Y2L820_9THEO|nr:single-stranded DNA-binding protein [Caldanaerobacter subterraneus]NNG67533.1 single-stranded DNA-binding protein [Caldanaerobacter subterraneus]